jgi:hypothetical protein
LTVGSGRRGGGRGGRMGGVIEGEKERVRSVQTLHGAPVGWIRWRLAWWRDMRRVVVAPYPFLAVDFGIGGSSSLLSYSSIAAGNRRSLDHLHYGVYLKAQDCGVVAAVTVLAGTRPSPVLTPVPPMVSANGPGAPDVRRLHHHRVNEKHRTTILETHPPSLSVMLPAVGCHSLKVSGLEASSALPTWR